MTPNPRTKGAESSGGVPLAHVGYWAAACLVVLMGWALYEATQKARDTALLVGRTFELLENVAAVGESVGRADAAQRGFLLTGSDRFLAQREEAIAAAGRVMQRLHQSTAGDPTHRERVAILERLIADRVAIMRENEVRRREQGLNAASVLVATGVGQEASAKIYALVNHFKQDAAQLLDSRRAQELESFERARGVLFIAVLASLTLMIPGYVGYIVEARGRQRAERRFLDLAETLPGAVVEYRTYPDGRSKYEYLSTTAERMRGIDRQAALANPEVVLGTILESDRGAFLEALANGARNLSIVEHDYRVRAPDGSVRWMRTTAAPRAMPDGSVLWSAFWADVTEKKALVSALREAKEEAERASRAKSTFLATMSHEIRTPMNAVLGMLELLSMTRLDQGQRTTLQIVSESGKSLLRIIDDILDFSKIEAGKLEIRPEVASIARVVESVRAIYVGNASSKGLLMRTIVDPRISPAVRVDRLRLQQILNNFVSNAIKFSSEGEIVIRAELVELRESEQTVRLSVEDRGAGIAPEALARLLQPFTQESVETTRRFGGTGLGLSICRRLAELMGGVVEIRGRTEGGTAASLTLPLPIADEAALPEQSAASSQAVQVVIGKRRAAPAVERARADGTLVLLADDHPINRMVLLRQLNMLGYAVEAAENGREALEKWKAGGYALVLTDCHMPEMDGYDLAKEIRRLEPVIGTRRTPIIACTANALAGEAQNCYAAGMDDYVPKPVELSVLMGKMDQWLPIPAASAIPIDPAAIAGLCGGDAGLECELLVRFRSASEEDAQAVVRAAHAENGPALRQAAHRLKGASRAVGAVMLAAICERLESAARDGGWPAIRSTIPTFQHEHTRVSAYLESLLGHAEPVTDSSTA